MKDKFPDYDILLPMKQMIKTLIFTAVTGLAVIAALAIVPVDITDTDNGKTIDVLRFRTIKLTLETNPTTGYGWQLVSPNDRKILRLYYSKYRPSTTKLLGAGGTEEWKFRAMAAGTTTIKLIYLRVWEGSTPPAKEFTINVRVR